MEPIVERLLSSDEPSVRFKVRVNVLGEDPVPLAPAAPEREAAPVPHGGREACRPQAPSGHGSEAAPRA